jgi:hypothetical protein
MHWLVPNVQSLKPSAESIGNQVEAGTGRVKVGMSQLEMLFRPLGISYECV